MKKHFFRAISLIVVISILCMTFSGCSKFSSKHQEMHYESNDNESIDNWGDNVEGWDNANIETWEDAEAYGYEDAVVSQMLFEDILAEAPIVECVILDYKSNGDYFDGDMVYSMVNDKFDVNSFVVKYAVGTGVIVIFVVLNIVTYGSTTPVACFIAGAAKGSITMAAKGSAFGAAIKAVTTAIKTDGNIEETLYGALEGSADGYMWGAIYGAATGGINSQYCFTGDTLVQTENGLQAISELRVGDIVLSYDEEADKLEYDTITQVTSNYTDLAIIISAGDDRIESTLSHPYLTPRGWIPAGELHEGDRIKTQSGSFAVIDSVEGKSYEQPIKTYTLCVGENHSFLVGNNGLVVHNKCNINNDYAGKNYQLKDSALAKKYPKGVDFTNDGFPNFKPYAKTEVSFDLPSAASKAADTCLTGVNSHDFAMANKAAGFASTPKGYTWHHCEDMKTLQLVPTDLHMAVRHTGGASLIRTLLAALGN